MFWLITLQKIKISPLFSNQHTKCRSFKWLKNPFKISTSNSGIFKTGYLWRIKIFTALRYIIISESWTLVLSQKTGNTHQTRKQHLNNTMDRKDPHRLQLAPTPCWTDNKHTNSDFWDLHFPQTEKKIRKKIQQVILKRPRFDFSTGPHGWIQFQY